MRWTDILTVFSVVLTVLSFYPLIQWLLKRLAEWLDPRVHARVREVLVPWLEEPECQLSEEDRELLQAVLKKLNVIAFPPGSCKAGPCPTGSF